MSLDDLLSPYLSTCRDRPEDPAGRSEAVGAYTPRHRRDTQPDAALEGTVRPRHRAQLAGPGDDIVENVTSPRHRADTVSGR